MMEKSSLSLLNDPKRLCLRLEEYVKAIFLFVDQPHCLLAL